MYTHIISRITKLQELIITLSLYIYIYIYAIMILQSQDSLLLGKDLAWSGLAKIKEEDAAALIRDTQIRK